MHKKENENGLNRRGKRNFYFQTQSFQPQTSQIVLKYIIELTTI